MTALPVRRVVLYKHGVGYFEREAEVDGDADLEFAGPRAATWPTWPCPSPTRTPCCGWSRS
jgi:hypothetical protein